MCAALDWTGLEGQSSPMISLGPGRARALCGGRDSGLDVTSESLQKVHGGLLIQREDNVAVGVSEG